MENNIIQILVQGGLASTSIISLWINYKLVTNHFQHQNDIMVKIYNAFQDNTNALKNLEKHLTKIKK